MTIPAAKAAVLLSGGIDSAAVTYLLKNQGHEVRGIFVDFGQAAVEQERLAVRKLAAALAIELTSVEARSNNSFGSGELIARNAFLLMTAMFLGQAHQGLLAIGVHAGTPYYDCSPPFIVRMRQVAEEHTDGRLIIVAPFAVWNKAEIFEYFLVSGLPIDATYSCESGTIPPCGSCASCRDRRALGC